MGQNVVHKASSKEYFPVGCLKKHDKICKLFQLQKYVPRAKMINAKKSDVFDIIWKFATLLKICIENGQINTKKLQKKLNGHKTSMDDQMSSN